MGDESNAKRARSTPRAARCLRVHTREIAIAARMGGGDPGGNARLRKAMSAAKADQMPNDRIDRAIKRGTGEIEGVSYEEVLYEGTGPGGTLLLVEGTTDNKNRTVAELRKIFDKHNGSWAPAVLPRGRSIARERW
jgi:transcriptional/translational regulatory protein YebC/TACO1